jgi:putative selenate reductase molybdopterin-binding subunit
MALAMIATIPPRGHVAEASASLEAGGGYTLRVGTAEFGNGTTTVHTQIAATLLGTEPERITLHQSDTDAVGYDTGAFGSAGSVVAGRAVHAATTELRRQILDRAAALTGGAVRTAARQADRDSSADSRRPSTSWAPSARSR